MPVVAPGVDVSTYPVGVTFRFPPTNPGFFPHFPPSWPPRLILPALLGQVAADTKDGKDIRVPCGNASLYVLPSNLNHNCYSITASTLT